MAAEAELVHGGGVGDRQLDAVEDHPPATYFIRPSMRIRLLPEGRLAAAGLAGEAHDLAVGDLERDAVESLDVAREGPVVDPEVA